MNAFNFATGGGAGMALAHCIVHGHTPTDLHEADPKRFPSCLNSAAALAERVPEVLGKHYEITYPARQWATSRGLRPMPLDGRWRTEGAHFGQVYGFERPLYFATSEEPLLTFGKPAWFEQVGRQVKQAHERAVVFDQSTFGKIRVTGRDAEAYLDRICTDAMSRPPGRAVYTLMLNERGGIESDLVALRLGDQEYRLYVGTAAVKRGLAWLKRNQAAGEAVTFDDETEAHAVLALTGPKAAQIADVIGAGDLNTLAYFRHGEACIAGIRVRGMHSSYAFANYLHYVAAMGLRNWHMVTRLNGDLSNRVDDLTPSDVVVAIAIKPCAADTVRVVRCASESGAWVIGITDSRTSPLATYSNDVLIVPVRSPSFFQSYVATLALIEVLVGMVVARGHKSIVENMDKLERCRRAMGEYWTDE